MHVMFDLWGGDLSTFARSGFNAPRSSSSCKGDSILWLVAILLCPIVHYFEVVSIKAASPVTPGVKAKSLPISRSQTPWDATNSVRWEPTGRDR